MTSIATTTKDALSQKEKRQEKRKQDFKLVCAAVDGDQVAYKQLMDLYKHSVYNHLYKMVKNAEDAEDLTIEAFGKAFNKLSTYTPNFAFSTWLFTIATNNCIDHIRKKRIETLSIDALIDSESKQDFSSNVKCSRFNPEEQIIKKQRVTMVREIISQLNDKYRTMIELRFFDELSYEEIAAELQIPLGTVKAQLFRAKELLYNYLKKPETLAHFDTIDKNTKK